MPGGAEINFTGDVEGVSEVGVETTWASAPSEVAASKSTVVDAASSRAEEEADEVPPTVSLVHIAAASATLQFGHLATSTA